LGVILFGGFYMDIRLEELSDKVRRGVPINFWEAIEVIEYQDALKNKRRAAKSKTILGRMMHWVRGE
jgi:hypothetical protein